MDRYDEIGYDGIKKVEDGQFIHTDDLRESLIEMFNKFLKENGFGEIRERNY